MKAIFGFPDTAVAGADREGKTIADEVTVDKGETNSDPVYEGDCEVFVRLRDWFGKGLGHTESILVGVEAVSSGLDWLLEEDWCQSIHCNVESERNEGEDTHYQCDWRHCHEEWNSGDVSLNNSISVRQ